MGASASGKSTKIKTVTANAEQTVTPAVARSVEDDAAKSTQAQNERRDRLRGIRSTFNRFSAASNAGGTTDKLG